MIVEQETIISGTEAVVRRIVRNLPDGIVKSYLYSILPDFIGFFWAVVFSLIVYYIGVRLIAIAVKVLKKSLELRNVEQGGVQFISSFARVVLYGLLFIIILTLFGVSTVSISATLASVALAAGLALQGSLSHFAGGILITVLRPFVVGDYIVEHTYNNEGIVTEITIMHTMITTVDNKVVIIPNGVIANGALSNLTKNGRRMINLEIPIAYEANVEEAKRILTEVIQKEEKCLKEEGITVFVSSLGDSGVNLGYRFWVATPDYWPARWHVVEAAKAAFDENGISIPYNKLDVNLVAQKDKA